MDEHTNYCKTIFNELWLQFRVDIIEKILYFCVVLFAHIPDWST